MELENELTELREENEKLKQKQVCGASVSTDYLSFYESLFL